MSAPVKLVIDTNVWLNYFLPDRRGHEQAFGLLQAACEKDALIMFPLTALKDVFYLAGAVLKRCVRSEQGELSDAQAWVVAETCWGIIETMGELGTPVGADLSDVWLARKYRSLHSDFEDDLVLAAAQRAGADVLVTEDIALIQHAPVCAMTAQDAIRYLDVRG